MTQDSTSVPIESLQPASIGYLQLIKAVLYREYLIFVRYPLNAVGGLFSQLAFFILLFYGGKMLVGHALTDQLEGIIVGYFLWSLSVSAYYEMSGDLGREVQWGTLERHFITPFGFAPIALAKGVAKIVRAFLTSLIVLGVMILITGKTLSLGFLTIVPVATLSILSVLGLGFAAGGVTVLYKRIGSLLTFLQFTFIPLISAPAFNLAWTRYLPLAQGSALLQRAMVEGDRLWELPPLALAVLVGTAVGYLLLGYFVFHLATRRARRLGVLGHY
ncbi:ABC transporter permease [Halorussus salinus]|uniref:ABC transporter permease n=1 Tax=Halorussus salinus TaxID=1364935 RepID=UPI001092366E|nr:ABC transporter permease [Halorussus salinus]